MPTNRRGRPKGTSGKAAVLTDRQVRIALRVARARPQLGVRAATALTMSLCLGLRAKELAALSLADVFNRDQSLREVLHLKGAYSKGAKARDIFVSAPPLIRQLREYRQAIGDRDPAGPMFPSRKGGYLRPGSMARFLTLILREAGIEHASSHSGRRTLITRLAERGVDLKAIAVIAGHSNIRTTAIYVESSPVRLSRILEEVTW